MTAMKLDHLLALAVLRVNPDQRLVHQDVGLCNPKPVTFFRLAGCGLRPRGGLHTLHALIDGGWIVPTDPPCGYSDQTEYVLSAWSGICFTDDARFSDVEAALRAALAGAVKQ